MSKQPIDAVVIGAGSRGLLVYGYFTERFPTRMRIIAVAEPDDKKRESFAKRYKIAPDKQFRDWSELLDRPRMAPVLLNATGDRLHLPVMRSAIERGYHIIQEKPIAATIQDCVKLTDLAVASDRIIQVTHGLRYTPYYRSVREVVRTGRLGELITIEYKENLSIPHMSHSFVRGIFSNTAKSSPMIIQKTCHDLDIIPWVIGKRCLRLSSFGSLRFFKPEYAPPGATQRCTDGCPVEPQCPFSAIRHYITNPKTIDIGYGPPPQIGGESDSYQERMRILETNPHGRCVWHCDNDVVDHQVINMEFEDGITVAFTLNGFGPVNTRTFCFFGSKAALESPVFGELKLHDHYTGAQHEWQTSGEGGHGGGDWGMIHNFLDAVERDDASLLHSGPGDILQGYLIGFAAEESRLNHTVIDLAEYEKRVRGA